MRGKDEYDSHVTIRIYMLLFAECDDDHEATSKPNASTIRELEKIVHKMCTGGWVWN
jgi:hypothetical protein